VFFAREAIVRLGHEEVAFVKERARASPRGRARICAHPVPAAALHEMLIAVTALSYIHPHMHLGKAESFHVVEGEVDIVIFDAEGRITELVELGEFRTNKPFYYRLEAGTFHALVLRTDMLVFHEVTNGPFVPSNTALAAWAPAESDIREARRFMSMLEKAVANFRDHGISKQV
jgi:cupin fold WbuC family metalloprotein